MRYDAIIFDLFGTLIDNFSVVAHDVVVADMATVLGAPHADFARLWNDETWPLRATGALPTTAANISYICDALGVVVTPERVAAAAQLRIDFTRRSLVPRPDALPTLTHLHERGYPLGLISDCSSEVPLLWPTTPFAGVFAATIFSSQVGMKKPDPRIYHLACDHLAVTPTRCLYIGDGSSHELTGAQAVGMTPVLIRDAREDAADAFRRDEEGWHGTSITTLHQVLPLVE